MQSASNVKPGHAAKQSEGRDDQQGPVQKILKNPDAHIGHEVIIMHLVPVRVTNNLPAFQAKVKQFIQHAPAQIAQSAMKSGAESAYRQLKMEANNAEGSGKRHRALSRRSSKFSEFPAKQSGRFARSLKVGPVKINRYGGGIRARASVLSDRRGAENIAGRSKYGRQEAIADRVNVDTVEREAIRAGRKTAGDLVRRYFGV